jgi:hypothetical protein
MTPRPYHNIHLAAQQTPLFACSNVHQGTSIPKALWHTGKLLATSHFQRVWIHTDIDQYYLSPLYTSSPGLLKSIHKHNNPFPYHLYKSTGANSEVFLSLSRENSHTHNNSILCTLKHQVFVHIPTTFSLSQRIPALCIANT